jgi:glycosyltransferase involved in cell wall biosynthesis
VLTGAIALDDERKGGVFLKSALASLVAKYGQTMAVCSFGANSRPESFGGLHVQLGATRDPRLLNLWYNAADVFVLPSRMESFGLVYVEAMAAGTPSVAFRVSACPEVVFDGATGVLAEDGDADDLARGIREILESDAAHGEERRRYCRSVAESRFDLEREVGEYAQLYAQLSTK